MEMEPTKCPLCGQMLSMSIDHSGPRGVTDRIERHIVVDALATANGDREEAAALLNISVAGLGRRIKKHNIYLRFE